MTVVDLRAPASIDGPVAAHRFSSLLELTPLADRFRGSARLGAKRRRSVSGVAACGRKQLQEKRLSQPKCVA